MGIINILILKFGKKLILSKWLKNKIFNFILIYYSVGVNSYIIINKYSCLNSEKINILY